MTNVHQSADLNQMQQQLQALRQSIDGVEGSLGDITLIEERLKELRHSIDNFEGTLEDTISSLQRMHQNDEQFRLLVTNVGDYAIFMLDPEGKVITWNRGARLIKGYTANEIIGQHFSIFYTQEDRKNQKPTRALHTAKTEGVFRDEGWRVRKDGTRFWASVILTALVDEDGLLRGFSKITHDLTERRQAEQALKEHELQLAYEQAARERAEELARLRDTFLSAVAHEFRTPITTILGYAELFRYALPQLDLPEQLKKAVHIISLQSKRLERLASMVLTSTRLESGTLQLELQPFDVGATVAAIVEELQLLSHDAKIHFQAPDHAYIVNGSEAHFEQAVYNIIQNAIKYSPAQSDVFVELREQDGNVVVKVEDHGIGISEKDLPHIGERFYRASNGERLTKNGLGIGLFLVKEFITLQNGRIEISSVEGEGTTVQLILPALQEVSVNT